MRKSYDDIIMEYFKERGNGTARQVSRYIAEHGVRKEIKNGKVYHVTQRRDVPDPRTVASAIRRLGCRKCGRAENGSTVWEMDRIIEPFVSIGGAEHAGPL